MKKWQAKIKFKKKNLFKDKFKISKLYIKYVYLIIII